MSTGILFEALPTPKIIPPQPRNIIPRVELLDLLDKHKKYPLIMVVSQAGSGKTMLAGDFARQLIVPVAWYSLDSTDTNFFQFCSYLNEAIKRVVPDFGYEGEGYIYSKNLSEMSQNLNAEVVPELLVSRVANYFLQDLELLKQKLATAFWIIIDDYQFAAGEANTLFLSQIARWLPEDFHLLILSRDLPPKFPYAEFVARQFLHIVRPDQLKFSLGEVETFIEQRYGKLGSPVAQKLHELTNGWAVALNLTLLSLEQFHQHYKPNSPLEEVLPKWLSSMIDPLNNTAANFRVKSGDPTSEPLFNYLANTLFVRQPAERQKFLLQTSLLEVLSEENCRYITGLPDVRQHLESLEQERLFLNRLDNRQYLYQYHLLVRSFLRLELSQNNELYLQTCRQVAELYQQENQNHLAIEYWLNAGEEEKAVALLEENAIAWYDTGKSSLLTKVITLFPQDTLKDKPNVLHAKGILAQDANNPEEACYLLSQAEYYYTEHAEKEMYYRAKASRAAVLAQSGQLEIAKDLANQILTEMDLEKASPKLVLTIGATNLTLAVIAQRKAEFAHAENYIATTENLFASIGDNYRLNLAIMSKASLYVTMGQLIKAKSFLQRNLDYWRKTGYLKREVLSKHYLALILRKTGRYEDAIQNFETNLAILEEIGFGYLLPYTCHELGDCYRETANFEKAFTNYELALEKSKGKINTLEIEIINSKGLAYWLEGKQELAREAWAEALELTEQYILPQKTLETNLGLVLANLDRQLTKKAQEKLVEVLQTLEKYPDKPLQSQALLLQALIYFKQDLVEKALAKLLESLNLADNLNYYPYLPCQLERLRPLLLRLNSSKLNLNPEDRESLNDFIALQGIVQLDSAPKPFEPDANAEQTPPIHPNIKILGLEGGKILVNDKELDEWAKMRQLLFYLAENPGASVDKIITDVWDEESQVTPATVYSLISRLKKAIPNLIISKHKSYRLQENYYYYDAQAFEKTIKPLLAAKNKVNIVELEKVLQIHQSEFLINFSGLWLERRRRQLLDLYIEGAALLGQIYYKQGQYLEAIAAWRRVLNHDELHDEAHRTIIAAYRALGQETEARNQDLYYQKISQDFE